MLWWLLALIAAFLDAVYFGIIKRHINKIDLFTLASGIFLTTGVIMFFVSAVKGFPCLQPGFLLALLITSLCNVVANYFVFNGLKTADMSLCVPMLSFTPLFQIFTSSLLMGESPQLIGLLGIILIVLGSYILNTTKDSKLLYPLRSILRNKGVLLFFFTAVIWSVSTNFDKMIVLRSDWVFGLSLFYLFLGLSFLIIGTIAKKHPILGLGLHYRKLLLPAIVISLSGISINIALTMQIVPFVYSIKRLSVVFSVLYGTLLLKERGIARRLPGALIMLGGVLLILLG